MFSLLNMNMEDNLHIGPFNKRDVSQQTSSVLHAVYKFKKIMDRTDFLMSFEKQ